MSLLVASQLYEALRADLVTAVSPSQVFFGLPRIEPKQYPFVVIRLAEVPFEMDSLTTLKQTYSFEIIYREAWQTSSSFNVELTKEARANDIITVLHSGSLYADLGVNPMVSGVNFIEADDPNEPYFEVMVTFQCEVFSLHTEVV